MSRFGIFIWVLWSLMTCSFGFTNNHSVVYVPPAWDTAPSLDTYRRLFVDPLKGKMPVTGMDRSLQIQDAKMMRNQTDEKKSATENIEMKLTEMKPIKAIVSEMRNDAFKSSEENANDIITPRNTILLLIDERDQDEKKEDSWKDYKERLPFAIEGFLQSCRDKIESANFSNTSVSGEKEKGCDCERVLLSNIEQLLSWARQERGMTIGTVSGSNFSIPFFPRYESSGSNESNVKLKLRESKRDSNHGWQMIDLSDRADSVSPLITADSKTEGDTNYDTTWDIFDMLSKIRTVFFRSLLESLHRNGGAFENGLSSARKSFSPKSTVTHLIENVIRELKSIPNDKGYMLIAAVPRSEGVAAINLLQREASLKDTLLTVMQICVGDRRSVPFAAQGPNCRILRQARVIEELPIIIKKAMITRDCRDAGCTNRQRRNVLTGGIFSQELSARKRVIRNENAEKPNTVKTGETIGEEIRAKNSASLKSIPCGLVAVLVAKTSILAKTAMIS